MKFDDHFLSWTLVYGILIFLVNFLLGIFSIGNYFFVLLFAGFILALGSWIFYSILYKNKFRLNWWFLVWIFTHAVTYWLITLILSFINLGNQFIYYLLFGLIFHLFTYVIKYKIYESLRIKNKNTKLIFTTIILIVTLFFISSADINSTLQTNTSNINSSNSFGDTLKSLFGSVSLFSGSCPQLNYPMQESGNGKYLPDKEYDGWFITSENYLNQISNPLLSGMGLGNMRNPYKIVCSKGNQKGENLDYWYCGETYVQYNSFNDNGYAVIIKPTKNTDGSIGDTIIKTFVNIYDKEGNFIKTTCGKAPDSLREDAFKEELRVWDDFFSLD